MRKGILKIADSTDAVNGLPVRMNRIKGGIVLIGKIANDAAGNGNTHTQNIDDNEQLVLHHAAKGNEQIVSYHGSPNANKCAKTKRAQSCGKGRECYSFKSAGEQK